MPSRRDEGLATLRELYPSLFTRFEAPLGGVEIARALSRAQLQVAGAAEILEAQLRPGSRGPGSPPPAGAAGLAGLAGSTKLPAIMGRHTPSPPPEDGRDAAAAGPGARRPPPIVVDARVERKPPTPRRSARNARKHRCARAGCGKAFTRASDLKRHMRNVHAPGRDARPFGRGGAGRRSGSATAPARYRYGGAAFAASHGRLSLDDPAPAYGYGYGYGAGAFGAGAPAFGEPPTKRPHLDARALLANARLDAAERWSFMRSVQVEFGGGLAGGAYEPGARPVDENPAAAAAVLLSLATPRAGDAPTEPKRWGVPETES